MAYPTDLTDSQWELIEELFDTGNYGKNLRHSKRVLVNAVNGVSYPKITRLGRLCTAFTGGLSTTVYGKIC